MATLTASDLCFEPEAHAYSLPDGRVVPSVTQILAATGVSTNFAEIERMSSRHAKAVSYKRDLGSLVHETCHAWDDADLVEAHPAVQPYLDAWIAFREAQDFEPEQRERMVFHPASYYCGTLDALGIASRRGVRVLVDIKIGDPEDAAAQFQTAAYAEGYRVEHPETVIDERWSVQLVPGAVIPYRIHPYDAWDDWRRFQAFAVTYHSQAGRRKKR